MDEAMSSLGGRLGELSVAPTGPPYARYHAWGGELADVEIGFPLAARPDGLDDLAAAEPGQVGASQLPGGRAALTVHRGPYTELGTAYSRLHDWIHAQGFDEGPAPWESYIDDPAQVADVAQLRTEILWPVPDR
jgi:effector-binding domain-containing protein